MPIGSVMPSWPSTINSCGSRLTISHPGVSGIALAESTARSMSSSVISFSGPATATTPFLFSPRRCSPERLTVAPSDFQAADTFGLANRFSNRFGDGLGRGDDAAPQTLWIRLRRCRQYSSCRRRPARRSHTERGSCRYPTQLLVFRYS